MFDKKNWISKTQLWLEFRGYFNDVFTKSSTHHDLSSIFDTLHYNHNFDSTYHVSPFKKHFDKEMHIIDKKSNKYYKKFGHHIIFSQSKIFGN